MFPSMRIKNVQKAEILHCGYFPVQIQSVCVTRHKGIKANKSLSFVKIMVREWGKS